MKNTLPLLLVAGALSLAGCAPGYTSASVVYAEPAEYVYVVPVDRVVVVTREVLVNRGWVVYRVQRSGPNRIIWARRGDDEVVRIFATPHGQQGRCDATARCIHISRPRELLVTRVPPTASRPACTARTDRTAPGSPDTASPACSRSPT